MMSKPTEDVPPTTDEPPSADTLVGENSLKLNQENETTNSPNLTLSHANEEVQPEMVDGISLNADGESPQKVQSSDPAVRHESEVVQLEVFDVVPLDVDEELTQSQQSPDLTFPTESEAIPSEVSDGISLNADEESPQRPSDYEVEFFPPILPQVIATVSPPDDINPDEFSSTKTPYDVEMASGTGHHDGSVVTLDDEIAVDEFTVSTLGEVSARPHWKSGGLSVGFLNGDDQSMEDDSLLIPPPMKVNESLERKHTEANSSEADSDVHPSDDVKMKMTNRRRYISVLIAISTLMFVGALCVLGVSFIHLRRTTQDEAPTAVPEIPKDVWDFEQPRTSPPSQSTSTSVPTAGPTSSPTPIPMEQIIFSNLIAIVAGLSPTFAIDDTGSSQFRAMEWMSHDPNYFSYPYEQIVQRWTMAVLLDSLGIPILPESGRSLQSSGFWSFEHECEWFPGENVFECDESNRTIGIQFRNKGLVGTIPPEIGLLTSVEQIYLSFNSISGYLPPQLGTLTNLVRLQVSNNAIEGTIPPELGSLANLAVLGLGANRFVGAIPVELGLLQNLETLGLEQNLLEGTIPEALAGMVSLVHLTVASNRLEGEIPWALTGLTQLETLSVHRNYLNGSVPDPFCLPNIFNETISITADCSEIWCTCCSFCCWNCDAETNGEVYPVF